MTCFCLFHFIIVDIILLSATFAAMNPKESVLCWVWSLFCVICKQACHAGTLCCDRALLISGVGRAWIVLRPLPAVFSTRSCFLASASGEHLIFYVDLNATHHSTVLCNTGIVLCSKGWWPLVLMQRGYCFYYLYFIVFCISYSHVLIFLSLFVWKTCNESKPPYLLFFFLIACFIYLT